MSAPAAPRWTSAAAHRIGRTTVGWLVHGVRPAQGRGLGLALLFLGLRSARDHLPADSPAP